MNVLGILFFLWCVIQLITSMPRLGEIPNTNTDTVDYCHKCQCFHSIDRDCNLFERIHKKLNT